MMIIRKIVKILLRFMGFSILALLLLVAGLSLYLHYFFPIHQLEKIAQNYVDKEFGKTLDIKNSSISLFSGILFEDIKLSTNDSSKMALLPVANASIDKIELAYSFREILKKRVKILKINLVNPNLGLEIDNRQPTATPPPDSAKPVVFPGTLVLEQFSLENAAIQLMLLDTVAVTNAQVGHVNLTVNDLEINEGDLFQPDKIFADIDFSVNSRVDFVQKNLSDQELINLVTNLNTRANLAVNGLDSIGIKLSNKISATKVSAPELDRMSINFPVEIQINAQADLLAQNATINPFKLLVDNKPWIELYADTKKFKEISANVIKADISINQVLGLAKTVLPDSLFPPMELPDALLSITGLTVTGEIPDSTRGVITIKTPLTVHASAVEMEPGVFVKQPDVNVNLAALVNFKGVENIDVNFSAAYDSVNVALNDTLTLAFGSAEITGITKLDEKFLPDTVDVSLDAKNILGSNFRGDLKFTDTRTLQGLSASGRLIGRDIQLSHIPDMPLQATLSLNSQFAINSLDSILFTMRVRSDSLLLPKEFEEIEKFPSLNFITNLNASTDTTFSNINIENLSVKLNNLLQMNAHGFFVNDSSPKLTAELDSLMIFHSVIPEWLPDEVLQQLGPLVITGVSKLKGYSNIILDTVPQIVGHINFRTNQTNISLPQQFVNTSNLAINTDAEISSIDNIEAKVGIGIDSVLVSTVRNNAYLNSAIGFAANLTGNKLHVSDGHLTLPSVEYSGTFNAIIDSLDSAPIIFAELATALNATDTVQVVQDVWVNGQTDINAKVKVDSQFADIFASVDFSDLNVIIPNSANVDSINGKILIDQSVDVLSQKIISKASVKNDLAAGPVDYSVYKNYFTNKNMDVSTLTVNKVSAAEFEVSNIRMEAFLGNGRVDIPTLLCDVYGGNIGAIIFIDLAEGDIDNISYHLNCHFSGINSALLLPQLKDRKNKSVINANTDISGVGVNLEKGLDVEGYFYITEIGVKTADNLLRFLDPQGTDSGIRSTRLLLNRGFKPRLFSFDIRNGYFYPSVEFTQPWYFPVRLNGGQIELARIPINFVVESALQNVSQKTF